MGPRKNPWPMVIINPPSRIFIIHWHDNRAMANGAYVFCFLSSLHLLYPSPSHHGAQIYRPSFRENQPNTLVFSHWKRAFWACFRENFVYKFGHGSVWLACPMIGKVSWEPKKKTSVGLSVLQFLDGTGPLGLVMAMNYVLVHVLPHCNYLTIYCNRNMCSVHL